MMSPEPEHVCPVKCDGNGNKCPGLDTGRRCRSAEVTRTLSVQIADPHLSLMINIHTTDTQHQYRKLIRAPAHPDTGHCTGVPSVPRVVSPPLSLAYASLTGSSETEDKTQSYDSQHPAHLLSPAFSRGQYSTVSFFLLFYCI